MSIANSAKDSAVTSSTRARSAARNSPLLLFIGGLLLAMGLQMTSGCISPPDFADTPKIEFVGMSKDTIKQGVFQQDSVVVVFSFEDGDGDIGRDENSDENNVFFIDLRTGEPDNSFGIPEVPPQGSSNGIEGEVRILLFSTCCLFEDGRDPCTPTADVYDEVSYEIYLVDRAGNESNHITTPPITLVCN